MLFKDKYGSTFVQMKDDRIIQLTSAGGQKIAYGFIIFKRPGGVEGLTKLTDEEEQTFMNTFAEIVFEGQKSSQTKKLIFNRPI